jgi:signal transduction histidine kinase
MIPIDILNGVMISLKYCLDIANHHWPRPKVVSGENGGKEHTISIKGKVIGTESDKLAKVFINGIQNVFKYEGDIHNITLYFKDGNTTKVMGFTAR